MMKSYCYFFLIVIFTYSCQNVLAKQKNPEVSNIVPGLPLAIFYDKNTTTETRKLIDRAISSINNGIKYGRNKWAIQIQTVEIDDSYKLIHSICQQMSRGALAIFGPTKWSTSNLLTSFTNYYSIPYISWSFLGEKSNEDANENQNEQIHATNEIPTLLENKINENISSAKSKEITNEDDYEIDYDGNNGNKLYSQVNDFTKMNKNTKMKSQLYMRPDIIPAIAELIKFYEWPTVYYIYNYEPAMINLESLFEYQNSDSKFVERILIRKIIDINDFRDMLRAIEASNDKITDKESKIIMIVDLDLKESYIKFLNHIKELGMTKTRFCYILATLGIYELNVNDFRHGGATLFGFSIVDYHNVNSIKLLSDMLQSADALNKMPIIPHDAALIMDALAYFSKKINTLVGTNMSKLFGMENVSLRRAEIYVNKSKGINCTYDFKQSVEWPLGKVVLDHLKNDREEYEGLTGLISFDDDGRRKDYKINIYKIQLNKPLTRIGHFTTYKGLSINEEKLDKTKLPVQTGKHIRKLRVVSIRDEPFFMLRDDASNYTGNDRFIGYCVDLTKRLAQIVNFTYELQLVKDNKFGTRDANGVWNGIVGELVRHEADLAVAPLTISSLRERAIEFSMPFMNIGISIMIKKPKKEKPGVFSFMAPLDTKIWLCVVLAYVGVSFVLFLVSRFSPYEWHYDPKKNEKGLSNDFTILNTLWFNLAAVMQQGVDIAPRSVSGRLVASAWWFFTLILISSYTANLAAFLTVERMVSPIESAEQLSRQTEIQYGAVEGGATKEFFKNSKVDVYMRMWNFMQSWGPSVFVKNNEEGVKKVRDPNMKYAFLLESSLNEYLSERHPCNTMKVGSDLDSKGYGVATPIGSDLKDPINLAILQLREEGVLDELKTRWWYDRSECGGNSGTGKDSSQNALDLINVAGIFYILIVGLVLSVAVVSLELLYKARILSQKNQILFSEAVKSKMRFSITGYDDSLNEFRNKMGFDGSKQAPYAD